MRNTFPVMGTVASVALATHRSAADRRVQRRVVAAVRAELVGADRRFSRYRSDSELQRLRGGDPGQPSAQMRQVMSACAALQRRSGGAFRPCDTAGIFDPTGYVKGWAIERAVAAGAAAGARDICLNVGGDVKAVGSAAPSRPWRVAVRSPAASTSLLAIVQPVHTGQPLAVATSGTYERGAHLWLSDGEPALPGPPLAVTTIGTDAGEVDACATAVWVRAREAGLDEARELLAGWPGVAGVLALPLAGRWVLDSSPAAASFLVRPPVRCA